MAQSSFPWENIDTSETQFSQMFRHVNNGVNGTPTTDELEVVAAFSGLAVDVEPGQAMVQGHYYINTTAVTVSLATADAVNDRIDTIVLRLDPVANTIVAAAVTGTPALSPVAPTLTQTEPYGVYEFPLANVLVPATAGVPGTITDRRQFMGERFGVWTTDNRPTPGTGIAFGYNTTLDAPEFYDGTEWRSVAPESLNDIGDVTITSATTGQILEWNGTAWVNGQVDAAGIASDAVTTAKILNANVTADKLASNSVTTAKIADANVTTAKLGPGTVLQVVNIIKTDVFSTSSGTPVDVTGFSVTITPRATSSKILVLVEPFFGGSENSTSLAIRARLLRNSTVIAGASGDYFHNTESGDRVAYPHPLSVLDSPNTTSPVTYKVQMASASGTVYMNRTRNRSEASSSSITVMEIAG